MRLAYYFSFPDLKPPEIKAEKLKQTYAICI